ncbi:hypothetical protein [Paenibacillus cremeus]|uniref:Uncharacterized protein n=1 Tax=Paenibacillus cremeus TaxID=2163881 RepID=A0A559KCV8_9BACL|nr:hypothetical protein [Paenibacillus cremeus]TVY09968.1 hypothetical protein FPZ49_11395 [Paenibacillus cremeus]
MYTLDNVDRVIENILIKLIDNQNLLKCLKYPSPDALSKPDLTQDEINVLFDYDSDPRDIRISFTPFNLTTVEEAKSELRIFIRDFEPENIHIANVNIAFQVIVSNRIWRLDEGKQRPLVIIQELLKSLNGVDIELVGNLYFNSRIRIVNYNAYFSGYELYPNVRSI